jgi:hypothetical protein
VKHGLFSLQVKKVDKEIRENGHVNAQGKGFPHSYPFMRNQGSGRPFGSIGYWMPTFARFTFYKKQAARQTATQPRNGLSGVPTVKNFVPIRRDSASALVT